MAKQKALREKGKFKMSRMFYEYREGDNVIIVRDVGFSANFPKRINGKVLYILTFWSRFLLFLSKKVGS